MTFEQITLPGGARLNAWLHSESPDGLPNVRPALILCPGGAYVMVSDYDMDPPATVFLAMGFQVFMLEYSLNDRAGNKQPLEDLARSVQLVRQNCKKWLVDPDTVLVMGFSAGGHLTASLGVHWNDPELLARCGAAGGELRPDGLILGYPVITAGEFAHRQSIENVSASCAEPLSYWSLETQVTDETPPAFLWHTMDDEAVPVENSMLFAAALHKHGVPCECHLFRHGAHGLSVCTREVRQDSPAVRNWLQLCKDWISDQFGPIPGY